MWAEAVSTASFATAQREHRRHSLLFQHDVVPSKRALNPAHINNIEINEELKKADVFLNPDQVSLAIGKGGQNIKLASMLTGYTIDVFREVEGAEEVDDIYLDEFSDEIDQWVIDAIKQMGAAHCA